jgi:hypothetical protein
VRELYSLLRSGLSAAAGEGRIRTAGICTNVNVSGEKGQISAMRVLAEHVDLQGMAMEVVLPYRKRLFGKYEYLPAETGKAQPEILV